MTAFFSDLDLNTVQLPSLASHLPIAKISIVRNNLPVKGAEITFEWIYSQYRSESSQTYFTNSQGLVHFFPLKPGVAKVYVDGKLKGIMDFSDKKGLSVAA